MEGSGRVPAKRPREPRGVIGDGGFVVLGYRGSCMLCGRHERDVVLVRRALRRSCAAHAKLHLPSKTCVTCRRDEARASAWRCVLVCRKSAWAKWLAWEVAPDAEAPAPLEGTEASEGSADQADEAKAPEPAAARPVTTLEEAFARSVLKE